MSLFMVELQKNPTSDYVGLYEEMENRLGRQLMTADSDRSRRNVFVQNRDPATCGREWVGRRRNLTGLGVENRQSVLALKSIILYREETAEACWP